MSAAVQPPVADGNGRGYGTLITWADELGLTNAAKLLKQTLAEEKKTDET